MRTCYGLGANAYLRKPVEFSRFVSAIETVTDFWLRLNNVPGLLPSVRER
jgi:hypothetical protein